MKTIILALAFLALAVLVVRYEPPPPPDPWLVLVPRGATDPLCSPALSRRECVQRRWEANRERIASFEPSMPVVRELAAIGLCAPGNIDGGPWVRLGKALRQGDWDAYNALINPCSCPRGVVLAYVALWVPEAFDRDKPLSPSIHELALRLIEGIEEAQTARGCFREPIADSPALASRAQGPRDVQP